MTPTTVRSGRALALNALGLVYIGGLALGSAAGLIQQQTMVLGIGVATMWAAAGLYFLDRVVRRPRAFMTRIAIAVLLALLLGTIARVTGLDSKVVAAVMLGGVGLGATLGAIFRPGHPRPFDPSPS